MELRHLRYFVAVAEELHFRRAAQRLHMSQPPLSQQIRALEREIGVTLLVRDRRGVSLTPSGRAFLAEARNVLGAVEHAAATARSVDRGDLGDLAIGFVGSTMYGQVPEFLRSFAVENPGVRVRLREMAPGAQLLALAASEIDIGFLRPPIAADAVTVETLFEEPLVVALPSDHRLVNSARVDVRALAQEAFVSFSPEDAPGVYEATQGTLADAGVVPRVVQMVTELQTAVGLVAAGLGVTFVPSSLMALNRTGVTYRPLRPKPRKVGFAVAYRTTDESPVVEAFLALARSM
ncbi:MAG: LysR substrate-binding domain-containing protein [Solirubrobacterales bacterium]|nr:LysR substrate-binding domain-containing protein [Solirubrobacterales bacterium]